MRFPLIFRKKAEARLEKLEGELKRIKGAYGEPCPNCNEVGGDLYIVYTDGYRSRLEMRCKCGSKRLLRYRYEFENPPQKAARKPRKGGRK